MVVLVKDDLVRLSAGRRKHSLCSRSADFTASSSMLMHRLWQKTYNLRFKESRDVADLFPLWHEVTPTDSDTTSGLKCNTVTKGDTPSIKTKLYSCSHHIPAAQCALLPWRQSFLLPGRGLWYSRGRDPTVPLCLTPPEDVPAVNWRLSELMQINKKDKLVFQRGVETQKHWPAFKGVWFSSVYTFHQTWRV